MRVFHRKPSTKRSNTLRRLPRLEVLEDRALPAVDPLFAQFQSAAGLLSLHGSAANHQVCASVTPGDYVQLSVAGRSYSSNPLAVNFDPGLAGATGHSLRAIQFDGAGGQDHLVLGNVTVNGGLSIETDGILEVQGQVSAGGSVQLNGHSVLVSGQVRADGSVGGNVVISADNVVQSGRIEADGAVGGGAIHVDFTGSYLASVSAFTSASSIGVGSGGTIIIDGHGTGTLFSSGHYWANAAHGGRGGEIDLFGQQVHLVGAGVSASGAAGGGWVRVGGDSPSDIAAHGGSMAGISFADTTTVDATTTLIADALSSGNGGRIVVWSQQSTTFGGTLRAQGAGAQGHGGLLEVSSAGTLTYGGHASATGSPGLQGQLLLDPANLVISDTAGLPQFNLINPKPDVLDSFGASVVALSNGNVVVTDPSSGLAALNAGAVFLYNGQTGALLATLTGSSAGDQVGSGGVTVLTNGNYVVSSPFWQDAGAAVGAATWQSASGSAVASVSSANSLVGSTAGDEVSIGDQLPGSTGVVALANGNYVVVSPKWQDGAAVVGAVTWGNGASGTSGAVSDANSLVGTTNGDQVGSGGVTALTNGNYVVASPNWQNPNGSGGAATWGNGVGGTVGAVSAANSLVSGNSGGGVASSVTALTNGNYVVCSPGWQDASGNSVGAATWANGSTGLVGVVSDTNSLVGSADFDFVGQGATALSNGSYVVSSPFWHIGSDAVGAVTWGASDGSTVGVVATSNSIVGSTGGDNVGGGGGGVTALSNGDFVISSPSWQDGGNDVGAVTWGDGTNGHTVNGVFEAVSAANSLVGSTNGDWVGYNGGNPGSAVVALSNGNYVVVSPFWQDNGNDVGAVTFGLANGTTIGAVGSGNSLVGSTGGDQVGSGGVSALPNGDYVVSSPFWQHNGTVGAVTWGGSTGITGAVATSNSLVGAANGDNIGSGGVTVLSNGNYVVSSPNWHKSGVQVGAATWANGTNGQTLDGSNTVDSLNSLVGVGAGSLLQQVVGLPGGAAFLASFTGMGGSVLEVQPSATSQTFGMASSQTVSMSSSFLEATLNTGTAVVLQASNDITVSSPIIVNNPSGNGGNLTLQAGRSIIINASITTDNGNLTLIANDTAADGVIDSLRGGGVAAITMTAGTALNTGSGNLTITLASGAGNTNYASDDITLGDVTGKNITITNNGPGDASIGGTGVGSGVDLASVTATGNLVVQSTGDITQNGALGPSDPGIVSVTGTTRLVAADLIVLSNSQNSFGSTVTFVDPGGDVTLAATGDLSLTSSGAPAALTVSATGTLTTNALFSVSGAASFTAGTIHAAGAGTKLQGLVSLSSSGAITLANTTALTLDNLTLAGNSSISAPGITFGGALNVGSYTLTLSSNSAAHLNGATTLAGGTISDSSGLIIGAGGTLSGSGTLQAGTGAAGVLAQVGATLSPDLSPGGLTVNGDLTLSPASILNEQIKSTSQFSQMTVNGAINLGNSFLQVTYVNPYTPASGDHFQIINNGPGNSISGTFAQGSRVTLNNSTLLIGYNGTGNNVVLSQAAPVVTVPGPQQFIANTNLVITGVSAADTAFVEGNGTVQVTLLVQHGVLTLGSILGLSFTQGTGTANRSMVFSGPLVYVNMALASITYRANQDSAKSDTLSINVSAGALLSDTKTISLKAKPGVFIVDPPATPKLDLIIQGSGNDVITVNPGAVAGAFVVNFNGVSQTYKGVNGRILVFDETGNNRVTIASTITLATIFNVGDGNNTLTGGAGSDMLVAGNGNNTLSGGGGSNTFQVGDGNNTLTGGAGNDTFTVGTGSNRIDGGLGSNTLIASGDLDFKLVGGTASKNGSLTKGLATDTLVLNHIQKAQLSLTGPGSHTIDGTGFSGAETLMGGTGSDTLKAGGGNDVLVGGSGNDVLVGGAGKNLLIAGGGAATITGGSNQDLIIGGTTSFDHNLAALNAIMAEWASLNSYAVKIKHLMGTLAGGLNGSTKLTTSTVLNNSQASTLTGGQGLDWFWSSSQDQVNDKNTGGTETATHIN